MSAKMLAAFNALSSMTRTAVKRLLLAVFITAVLASLITTCIIIAVVKIA